MTQIRRATGADADAVADVWLRSFAAALPNVASVHTDDQVRRWIADVVIERMETWVACVDETVVGLLALGEGCDLDQLYLDPSFRGQGIGDELVAQAKVLRPDGLELWTFQVNEPALRFYARHGFVEVTRTDGAGNEEHEPDVRLRWIP